MNDEKLRDAFKKIKQDITGHDEKISLVYDELKFIRKSLDKISEKTVNMNLKSGSAHNSSKESEHMAFINQYMDDVNDIVETIDRKQIVKAISILFDAWKNNNNVYFIGCGGSAGTASHFAADLSKTTMCKGKKRFKSHSLVDNPSLTTAWINDEGWENVFVGQIENFVQPGDVVVALSVHGGKGKGNALAWSQNLTKAMQFVKDKGGRSIGIAGFDGGAFKELADACIIVPKNSTPLVEGFHCDIQHMIIFRLKELIENYEE